METPLSTKESHHNTRPARGTPPIWFLDFFLWYINIPIAHICWVVTMIDVNGGLTGVRMEEFWRLFKIPDLGVSIVYYLASMFLFPLLASCLVESAA